MNRKYLSLILAGLLLTACGSSSSSKKNDGNGAIDLKDYYPNESMTKTFINTKSDKAGKNKSHYDEIIQVSDNIITYTIDTKITEKVVFTDKNITTTSIDDNETEIDSMFRHVDIGDTLFSKKMENSENNDLGKINIVLNTNCNLKSKEKKFESGDNIYNGDLLKIECISEGKVTYDIKKTILDAGVATDLNGTHNIYDTSYYYLQKDIGEVASINDDCIPNSKLPLVVNDKEETCNTKQYDYEFYLP